jgi:SAM-dependent methyltransferase
MEFGMSAGLPSLLLPDDEPLLDAFSRAYREKMIREGWRPLTKRDLLRLPFHSPPGHPTFYWQVRRQTFLALQDRLRRLGPHPESGMVADLGAGTGWLSYRLAEMGYRVIAVEANIDVDFGLGAAQAYASAGSGDRILAIRGSLETPPIQPGRVALVVLSASLHYARDLRAALQRISVMLKPGGQLFVVDTPVARHPRPSRGIGDRHLSKDEIEGPLRSNGLSTTWARVFRGPRWWTHQIKRRISGNDVFSFPMLIASRGVNPAD